MIRHYHSAGALVVLVCRAVHRSRHEALHERLKRVSDGHVCARAFAAD